jgi:hypothetical protein
MNVLGHSRFCKLQVVHFHSSSARNTNSNQFQQANHVIRGEFIGDLLASFTLATLMVKTFLGTTKAPRDSHFFRFFCYHLCYCRNGIKYEP